MTVLIAYVLTILAANWALQTIGFVPVAPGLMAPAGVYFAGLAYVLRNAVQETLGRRWSVAAILVGAALSYVVAPGFALASGLTFLAAEFADFAVYTTLRRRGQLNRVQAAVWWTGTTYTTALMALTTRETAE